MAPEKITRKELLKSPDEFLTLTQRAFNFVSAHSKPIITAAIVVVAAVALGIGIKAYSDYKTGQAVVAYAEAAAAVPAAQNFDPQKAEAAVVELEKVAQTYSGRPSARSATMDLGALYFKLGKFDQSEAAYRSLLSSLVAQEQHLKPLLLDSLAYVLEAKGNPAQAAASWEELLTLSGDVLKDQTYLNLGRVYQAQGQTDKAKEAYEKLVAGFPNSRYAALAQAKLTQL